METGASKGDQQGTFSSSFHSGRVVSFQSGGVSGSTEMISMDIGKYSGGKDLDNMFISSSLGTSNNVAALLLAQTPSTVLQSVPRFRHVYASPAYWSDQELEALHEGLLRYSNESSVKKYTKIAALLPDKTIRDVALRCQWMTNMENSKRRTAADHHAAKRMKSMKMVGPLSTSNSYKASLQNVSPSQLKMHHMNPINQFPPKGLDEHVQSLLVKNDDLLMRIGDNINKGQMEENIDLFLTIKTNIAVIEERINMMPAKMNQLPGIMDHMPPCPVSTNKELLNILSSNVNDMYSASGSSNHLPPESSYFAPNIR